MKTPRVPPNPYRLPLKAYGVGELQDLTLAITAELATRVLAVLTPIAKPA